MSPIITVTFWWTKHIKSTTEMVHVGTHLKAENLLSTNLRSIFFYESNFENDKISENTYHE